MKSLRNFDDSFDLPFEKAKRYGLDSLKNYELLAIFLRTGTKNKNVLEVAKKLYNEICSYNGIEGLFSLDPEELEKYSGIGKVKSIQLAAVFELVKRINKFDYNLYTKFDSPKKIAKFYQLELQTKKREHIVLLCLDSHYKIIYDEYISIGNINTAIFSPRDIIVDAMLHRAVKIVILHNHPCGDPNPSDEDIKLTKDIIKACDIVGLQFVDHIIIGNKIYFSMKQHKII